MYLNTTQISGMLSTLIAFIALVYVARAAEFPNGTSSKLHFFSCNRADSIDVSSLKLFDRSGVLMYPIRLQDLAVVKLKSYNKGDMVLKDKVDVMVYAYVEKNEKWEWKNIIPKPFQFLLNNIDGCELAHNCPLAKGDLNLTISLDLYKYSFLFKFIDKTVAHQFVIKLYNAEGHREISCVTVQFKLA